jgi:hypothetical protein
MSYGLIDVREWSVLVDLVTGKRMDPSALGHDIEPIQSIRRIVENNPYPGDFEPESIDWVTDVACELNCAYRPHLMILSYAQPYFLARFRETSPSVWSNTVDRLFESISRFTSSTGFTPVVVGLGGMTPLQEYIDLNNIDGLVLSGGGSVYYAGLFEPSARDLSKIEKMSGIEKIVSKREFIDEFGGSSDFIRRFPDYLLVAREGYTFKAYGGVGRPMYRIPAKRDEIPVYTHLSTESIASLTDLKTLIMKEIPSKKIALIILEAIGDAEFIFDHIMCSNKANWFTYTQSENQYLAITTGRHLQHNNYPPGYKYYIEDHETREHPYAGPFVDVPCDTIGKQLREKLGLRSAAVGNRSVLTHMTSGADIAIECLVRGLYNYGTMATISLEP